MFIYRPPFVQDRLFFSLIWGRRPSEHLRWLLKMCPGAVVAGSWSRSRRKEPDWYGNGILVYAAAGMRSLVLSVWAPHRSEVPDSSMTGQANASLKVMPTCSYGTTGNVCE